MARVRERWQVWWVRDDAVYFEDGWERYVATRARCSDGFVRLDVGAALYVLLSAFREGLLDLEEKLGVDPRDAEWQLRNALASGLYVDRRLSFAERRAAREDVRAAAREPVPETAFVAVEVRARGEAVAGVMLEIITPDGNVHARSSGPDGSVLLERIPPGTCRVRLPRHDASAWKGLSGAARLAERRAAHRHVVVSGECLSTIAHDYGHTDWRPVWEHADNETLRARRKSPHVLHPSDVVIVPGLQMAELACPTNATHHIEVELPTLELKVVLADHLGRPFQSQPYQLWCEECEGEPLRRGATDGVGNLNEELPRGTRQVFVLLEKQGLILPLQLSAVPELPERCEDLSRHDVVAIQTRLNALGVGAGPVTGRWEASTERALSSLRRARGAQPDEPLRAEDLEALRAFGV